ncbi:MAG: hypothetical protein ACOYK6_06300 [Chthoniobacterales bacterium]
MHVSLSPLFNFFFSALSLVQSMQYDPTTLNHGGFLIRALLQQYLYR